MKKKLLPLALAAAAGLTGVTAQAVHVNNEGTGQVLLYPFYTVEGTQDTLISLVNTTGETKAVKVRILEAMNSKEVLDFNLYLSPQDHWSAVITRNATGDGAVIRTSDTSCTSPLSLASATVGGTGATVAFRTFEFDGSTTGSTADSVKGLARTQEGYVEVIEMGVVTSADANFAADILHSQTTGLPADCAAVDAASGTNGALTLNNNTEVTGPTGGLYGYGVIIDPVDATALDSFVTAANHTSPGNLLPALSEALPASNQLDVTGGTFASVVGAFAGTTLLGLDAVSSVLMTRSIMNDYVLEPVLNAGTDWVITFPTKRDYVNNGTSTATAPFTTVWDPLTSSACEEITIDYFNREEGSPIAPITGNDFSPLPPTGAPDVLSLCYEANIMTFNSSNALSGSDRVKRDLTLESGFDNGWAEVSFDSLPARVLASDTAVEFNGLPVIGFAVQKYVNGAVNGTTANYAATVTHKRDGNQ